MLELRRVQVGEQVNVQVSVEDYGSTNSRFSAEPRAIEVCLHAMMTSGLSGTDIVARDDLR